MNKVDFQTLQSFADYEGTEYGESVGALLHLNQYRSLLSTELTTAINEELRSILLDIQVNWVFESREEEAVTKVIVHNWLLKD